MTVFDEATLPESLKAAATLRDAGLRTVGLPRGGKDGANSSSLPISWISPLPWILGPDEVKAGQVAVKNLKTREQEVVARGATWQMK